MRGRLVRAPDSNEPAPISDAARVQRRLWGTAPQTWARLAEAHNRPLFEAVLDAAGVQAGTRVLDVGCGSGLTLVLAARRGALAAGIDVSPGLLGVARERLPDADLREGDMEALPFDTAAFDAVLGVNAFQFAGDPLRALREAARVLRPGGRLVASLFAAPERSQATAIHEAMSTLVPPEAEADHAPYALSAPGGVEAALVQAGLRVVAERCARCCARRSRTFATRERVSSTWTTPSAGWPPAIDEAPHKSRPGTTVRGPRLARRV